MKCNSELPYIEFDTDETLPLWYNFNIQKKITELSRQVRTYLKCKESTILYRFRTNNSNYLVKNNEKLQKNINLFDRNASTFLRACRKINELGEDFENSLEFFIQKVNSVGDKDSRTLISELFQGTLDVMLIIHQLSEQELHHYPSHLKLVVELMRKVCVVLMYAKEWASEFYEELGKNYSQLKKEVRSLIPDRVLEKKEMRQKKLPEEF
ncbi:MAG: hypothetical protein GF383_03620 [Candidatus Lokiarchaeota archaeon]|nr:hypothetical protein [Candidatus Lokiarchaeota archaeon]MBD3338759.1 hypothetical protein [Candidatus Lokiarchaeota archaeon]